MPSTPDIPALRAALAPPHTHGLVLSQSGIVLVAYRDRFDWQIAREHWQVVPTYLAARDRSELEEFADATVAGCELMACPERIDSWFARAGRVAL